MSTTRARTPNEKETVGTYLGRRLHDLGISHFFTMPGDFTMSILDQLLKVEGLEMISVSNDFNAGYMADGYARAKGVSAAVLTYNVGTLGALNAIAGARSEGLPVLLIAGIPNVSDLTSSQLIHHTPAPGITELTLNAMKEITAASVRITDSASAPSLIDHAISSALIQHKPAYIEICCNVIREEVPTPFPLSFPLIGRGDTKILQSAVQHVSRIWEKSECPMIVGGVHVRRNDMKHAFNRLASSAGCAIAMTSDAKGLFSESNKAFIGTYWNEVATSACSDVISSADTVLWIGALFSDYSTNSAVQPWHIIVHPDRVETNKDHFFVPMGYFLHALADCIASKPASLEKYRNIVEKKEGAIERPITDSPLSAEVLPQHIQRLVKGKTSVIVDVGEAWFLGQKLKLGPNGRFDIQLHYSSMGWAFPAAVGVGLATGSRVLAIVGDGAFQSVANELSTMLRSGIKATIVLLNNGAYGVEEAINPGPYNKLIPWDYTKFFSSLCNVETKTWTRSVSTERELATAVEEVRSSKNTINFIDVHLPYASTSKELHKWGSRVNENNFRTVPRPV